MDQISNFTVEDPFKNKTLSIKTITVEIKPAAL